MKKCVSFFLTLAVIIFCCGNVSAGAPVISAKAAIVVNGATGEVIFEQNSNAKLSMASTTKIMTALLLCENADLDKEITTTREMVTVEGSSMGLLVGDKVTFSALLYGMMLPSGNDAATTVAVALGGSVKGFALMMNKKAAELHMDSTNFVTPSGLDDKLHYTTAADMAKLAVYAMKNKLFRKAVSTKQITLEYGNPPYRRTISGHNKILDIYDGGIGIKTGYTKKSGKCLVSAANRNGKEVIAVTLYDSSTWANHKILLDYGFSNLQCYNLGLPKEFSKIPVISGKKSSCKLYIKSAEIGLTSTERENLNYNVAIGKFIYAGAKKNTKVGHIDFYCKKTLLKSINIYTAENTVQIDNAEPKFLLLLIRNLKLLL